ncbi:MAG: N-acetylmuramic acid 6-phosphate etherase, partial [Rubricoccaceae bacterium]|nr:N-acetylmuramic acid 6-phosphate etherase [Rubricoccaceae bacterium]
MGDPNLFRQLAELTTEKRNPRSMEIDMASIEEALRVIHEEDKLAVEAVTPELSHIAKAVERVVEAFQNDGRLFYAGA